MKIEIRSHHVALTPELREFIERRLHFALRRFAKIIRHVTVRLRDDNGPKGGVDKACSVWIEAEPHLAVMHEQRDASIHAAAARAVERSSHSLGRAVARSH